MILILFSFKNKYSLSIFLLIVFPYFLIWSLFFVADNRNFLMVSPFLGFILSVGLINLIDFLKFLNSRVFLYIKFTIIIIIFVLSMFAIQIIKNDSKLISKSIEDKKLRGNTEINILLYNSLNLTSSNVDIFYIADSSFSYLPVIRKKLIKKSCIELNDIIKKDTIDKNFYVLLNTKYCNIDNLLNSYNSVYIIDKIFNYKDHQFYFFKS